jgi:exodeoxyribonuclease V alpha subunit
MADGSLKQVFPSRLEALETVYAMTVHKSQGSEFGHTAFVMPDTMSPVLTRELIYTGITRARSFFTLAGTSTTLLVEAVKQQTHRASGLGDLLFQGDSIPSGALDFYEF